MKSQSSAQLYRSSGASRTGCVVHFMIVWDFAKIGAYLDRSRYYFLDRRADLGLSRRVVTAGHIFVSTGKVDRAWIEKLGRDESLAREGEDWIEREESLDCEEEKKAWIEKLGREESLDREGTRRELGSRGREESLDREGTRREVGS